MEQAFDALVALGPDGVQLTPGNLPTSHFADKVRDSGLPVRFHHGFDFCVPKRRVYEFDGSAPQRFECWSVHPPLARESLIYEHWFVRATEASYATEAMYPGEWLGTGVELDRAMDASMRLAVDVSHLHIQRRAGALLDRTLTRLLAYEHIAEVHVSDNDGHKDLHRPLTEQSYLLDWVRAKMSTRFPVILECYMHRLSVRQRIEQVERVRERLS